MTNTSRSTKRTITALLFAAIFACAFSSASVAAGLTGDAKLACEALLCLSSPQRPAECAPSLKRYFSFNHKKHKWSDRKKFLAKCPTKNGGKSAK